MLSVNNYGEENHLLTELTLDEFAEVNGGWGLPKWAKAVAKGVVTVAVGAAGVAAGFPNPVAMAVGGAIGLEGGDQLGDQWFGGEDYIPHPTNPWPY